MTAQPKYLDPMLQKRAATQAQILADLLRAGLMRGECSANDITCPIPEGEENVIGGVFQKLRGCGFVQTGKRIKPAREEQHGRKVYVWRLVRHSTAQRKLRELAAALVRTEYFRREDQGELF